MVLVFFIYFTWKLGIVVGSNLAHGFLNQRYVFKPDTMLKVEKKIQTDIRQMKRKCMDLKNKKLNIKNIYQPQKHTLFD
jgi:hypothetical protein